MKAYTTASNARRAAKSAGLEQFEIIEVEGGFAFQAIAQEEAIDEATFEEIQESGDLEDRLDAALAVADASPVVFEETPSAVQAAADATLEKKALTRKIEVTDESTVERPCKLVWHIADDMKAANPEVKRKEVLAECVKRGVAFYTARTQYQQWLGVQKEMAARVASQTAE